MKKIISLLALLFTTAALAQSYPSPTFQNLTVLGTATLSGITYSGTANTVQGNATSGPVSGLALPSCSSSSSALQWTTGTGFACNSSINAALLNGVAASSYLTTSAAASTYAPIASPSFTGTVTIPSGASISGYAPLASPIFTGTPAAPTAAGTTNTTQLATTAMVNSAITGGVIGGSFTTLAASSTVSGTGFSNYLAAPPSIGSTTASTGKFTTLQATGLITPGGGILGVSSGVNAGAGNLGQIISSNIPSGSAVALTTVTNANITSITLTAGDWDVWGVIQYAFSAATATSTQSSFSLTTATIDTTNFNDQFLSGLSGTTVTISSPITPNQINVTTNTTVFLVARANFTAGTLSAYGFLVARRRQ